MPTTHDLIATATLNSPNTVVVFSSIPNTYTDLQIIARLMANAEAYMGVQFNTDTSSGGSNYSASFWVNTVPGIQANSARIAGGPVYSATTNDTNAMVIDINSYLSSYFKTAIVQNANGGTTETLLSEGGWRNTTTITSITLWSQTANNYLTGSTASLYGIKAG